MLKNVNLHLSCSSPVRLTVPDTLDNPALQFPLRLTYLTLQLIGKFNGDEGPEHFF